MNKTAAAVAMAVALGATAQMAQADVLFNNLQGAGAGNTDGFQSATTRSNFAETLVTGILTQGAGGNDYDGVGCGADGSHATLTATCLSHSNAGFLYAISKVNFNNFTSSAANSYTLALKIPVITWLTSPVAGQATLQVAYNSTVAGTGAFHVYANSGSQPNYQTGLGFNTGTPILSGTDLINPTLAAGLSAGGQTGTTNTAGLSPLNQTGLTSNVDGLVDSVTAKGTAADFYFQVTGGSIAYFPTLPATMALGFNLTYNQVTLDAPFSNCSGLTCDPRPTTNWLQAGGVDYTSSLSTLFGTDTNAANGRLVNNFTCGPQDESCGYLGRGLLAATFQATDVPEPGTLMLLGLGLAGLGAFTRRRRT